MERSEDAVDSGTALAHCSYLQHAWFWVADSVVAAPVTLSAVRKELGRGSWP